MVETFYTSHQSFIEAAKRLYSEDQFSEAIPLLDQVLGGSGEISAPDRAYLLHLRGLCRAVVGDMRGSARDLAEVTRMDKAWEDSRAERWDRLIRLNFRPGELSTQIFESSEVIRSLSSSADEKSRALLRRGVAYGERGGYGDFEKSVDDFSSLIEAEGVDPDLLAAAYALRGASSSRDLGERLSDLKQALETGGSPGLRFFALVERAKVFVTLGMAKDAILDLDAILKASSLGAVLGCYGISVSWGV